MFHLMYTQKTKINTLDIFLFSLVYVLVCIFRFMRLGNIKYKRRHIITLLNSMATKPIIPSPP